jgi:Ca2+-binding EF-hand superfamily protein
MSGFQRVLDNPELLNEMTASVFAEADIDGSGRLSKTELRIQIRNVAEELEMPYPSEIEVSKIFADLDSDGSHSLSKEEFKVYLIEVLKAFDKLN